MIEYLTYGLEFSDELGWDWLIRALHNTLRAIFAPNTPTSGIERFKKSISVEPIQPIPKSEIIEMKMMKNGNTFPGD